MCAASVTWRRTLITNHPLRKTVTCQSASRRTSLSESGPPVGRRGHMYPAHSTNCDGTWLLWHSQPPRHSTAEKAFSGVVHGRACVALPNFAGVRRPSVADQQASAPATAAAAAAQLQEACGRRGRVGHSCRGSRGVGGGGAARTWGGWLL